MDENKEGKKVESKKKRAGTPKGKTVAVVITIIMTSAVVALGAVCVHLYNENKAQKQAEVINRHVSGSSMVVSDDNRNVVGEINQKAEEGKIVVKMTQNWVFTDGGKNSNAYLANSERNSYDLQFEMTLADSGEVIMTSPNVPVGSCIENFSLEKQLDPGKYDVIISHNQIKDGEIYNTVRTSATITVK